MTLPENILTPVGNLSGSLTSGGLIPGVPVVAGSASGNPIHIMDGVNYPLFECKVNITPSQEGTGDPSPSNPRSINYYTNVTINVAPEADPTTGLNYYYDWEDSGEISGGYIDIITGKKVNTYRLFRLTSITYYDSTKSSRYLLPTDQASSGYTLTTNPFLCNIFKPSNYSTAYNDHIHFANTRTIAIYSSVDIGLNTSEWNEWLANNEVWICYQLATPKEEQLQGIPILTRDGENYISSDVGNLDIKYAIDMHSFLQWVYDNLYNP